jgi:uncharacterized protein
MRFLARFVFPPLAIALCGVTALCDEPLVGTWIGGYEIGNTRVSGSLVFRSPTAGVFFPQAPAGDSVALRSQPSGRHTRMVLADPWEEIVFDGIAAHGRWSGPAGRRRSSGRFAFARTSPVPAERLARFVGDYVLAPNETLVVGRSLGQLFLLAPDGAQRALWATNDSSFVGGASVGTSYPLEVQISFAGTGASAATLTMRTRGGPERHGQRVVRYDEQDVTFTSGDVQLAGTVLMPRTSGSHPGVVLVHGSNAQSRNGQRSIYRFHADYLARHGIAVLIYDKRGIGGSSGHWADVGVADDAIAAVRTLRRHDGVDSTRVGLWGLSQGTWLVVHAAATAPTEVAFIVPVGGGALHPHEQEIARTALQLKADGFSESDVSQAVELQRLKFHYASTGEGWDEYLAAIARAQGRHWLDDPYIGPPTSRDSPAWEFWRSGLGGNRIDVANDAPHVRCPVLAIVGALDTYSPPTATLARFDSLFTRGGNRDVRLWLVPGASHALFVAKTGGPKEEPYLVRYAPGYLDTLAAWIGRVRPRQAATSK